MPSFSSDDFLLIRLAFSNCFEQLMKSCQQTFPKCAVDMNECVKAVFCTLIHFVATDPNIKDQKTIKEQLMALLSKAVATPASQPLHELLDLMAKSAEQHVEFIDFSYTTDPPQWKLKQVANLVYAQGLSSRQACTIASIKNEELDEFLVITRNMMLKLVQGAAFPQKLQFDANGLHLPHMPDPLPENRRRRSQKNIKPKLNLETCAFFIESKEVAYATIKDFYKGCFEIALKDQFDAAQLEDIWFKTISYLYQVRSFENEAHLNWCFFHQLRSRCYRISKETAKSRIRLLAHVFRYFLTMPNVRKAISFGHLPSRTFMKALSEFEGLYQLISESRTIYTGHHVKFLEEVLFHVINANSSHIRDNYEKIKQLQLPLRDFL